MSLDLHLQSILCKTLHYRVPDLQGQRLRACATVSMHRTDVDEHVLQSMVSKETVRAQYDGSLFYQLARKTEAKRESKATMGKRV